MLPRAEFCQADSKKCENMKSLTHGKAGNNSPNSLASARNINAKARDIAYNFVAENQDLDGKLQRSYTRQKR